MEHVPVMVNEILEALPSGLSGWLVDATLGLGGYAEVILSSRPELSVLGIDQDPQALAFALKRLRGYGARFREHEANFSNLEDLLPFLPERPKGVLFDLGVSNMQLTEKDRGFSYNEDGPLDMRMSPSRQHTAADLINFSTPEDLARIFRLYGEERHAWRLATGIVNHVRKMGPILSTGQLVDVIREVLPAPVQRKMGGHPARRVFQALRIAVNDEMVALEQGLRGAERIAGNPCIVVAVSYHSLEDRIVKQTFRDWFQEEKGTYVQKKALTPTDEEIAANRKARSAKMRAFRLNGIDEQETKG